MSRVFGGMAASLDGYIASENGDLSWLNDAMAKDEDYGFEATERRTGAYIMGANTFREVATMGGGVPFFGRVSQWTKLELMGCRHYPSGIVLLNYRLKGPGTEGNPSAKGI